MVSSQEPEGKKIWLVFFLHCGCRRARGALLRGKEMKDNQELRIENQYLAKILGQQRL